jgi:hypothetical protein
MKRLVARTTRGANVSVGQCAPPWGSGRHLLPVFFALALLTLPGCVVYQHARRTLIHEPTAFSWKKDRIRSLKTYRQWADEAWASETGTCLDPEDEFALGFRDGFVDYVYAGGDGEPPPVPPRQFWNLAWRSSQGQSAAQEWFAGYRHGADVAREGGFRNSGIVLSSYRWDGPGPSEFDGVQPPITSGEELGDPIEPMPAPPEGDPLDDGMIDPQPPELPAPSDNGSMLPPEEPPAEDVRADESSAEPSPPVLERSADAPLPPDGAAPDRLDVSVSMRFRRAAARTTEPTSAP